MTNTDVTPGYIVPRGGHCCSGAVFVMLLPTNKAAQNDTFTITGISSIPIADLIYTADGSPCNYSITGNVITLTDETVGNVAGYMAVVKG